ncbi:DNA repair protein RecN [Ruania halotolerans]|uniref:DNA repair protein RecN n=1 Tax=Ruania halotolerans TaxID=2897773 RepID=UPI001E326968|nr:DNA repair protein RecN [Ruania halotolerans]UFU05055.1 DNA repair protein RecN [Ruania halotolerans]
MIEEIQIRDLGVIESATIELDRGLTVITGETGAGKTMVLTGLGLLLGGKADPGSIRPGAEIASVEGRFAPPQDHTALSVAADAGAMLDDGVLLVVRTLAPTRSRAHLGGRSVPQGLLAELGHELVTVHGQSEQIRLRSPALQRQALDVFAGPEHAQNLALYGRLHQQRQDAQRALERWDADSQAREVELDRLQRALERIDALEPRAGEDAELRAEAERLGNVEDLRAAAEHAHRALGGAEDPDAPEGALALVDHARRSLAAAADHDETLADWSGRLDTVSYQLSDVLTEIGSYVTGLEADPERLDQVHTRRSALTEAARTYTDGGELVELLAFAEDARARVAALTAPGAGRDALDTELQQLESDERDAAASVTQGRRHAARLLAEAVDAELAGLAMSGAHLSVALHERSALGPWGAEDVEFSLTPHPGAPARPLAKGASGGELSRVMLALEVAMARQQASTPGGTLPAFVFDEVDAGVGGQAAVEVGRRLAELARHTQVIVVTHLAQVAAFADRHLVVMKTSGAHQGAVTNSDIRRVEGPDREAELARMLSGDPLSETALRHAAELLERPVVGR